MVAIFAGFSKHKWLVAGDLGDMCCYCEGRGEGGRVGILCWLGQAQVAGPCKGDMWGFSDYAAQC